MELTFYRGITVKRRNVDEVLESIRRSGISGDEGQWWKFKLPDISKVRNQLQTLLELESGDDILNAIFRDSSFSGICACGDEIGGRYYALKHNRSNETTEPVLIVFIASLEDVYVDPRDFLCTAFQLWDRDGHNRINWQKDILAELFGSKILVYFERACRTTDQRFRIAVCNRASFDPEVVLSHYRNKKVIRGRYGTTFCSAFFVKCPVTPTQIVDCIYLRNEVWQDPNIFVTINGFISGNPWC